MVIFSRRFSSPIDEAVAKDQPPDKGTLGPNSTAKFNPKMFLNKWAADLYDSPVAKDFANQVFSSESAQESQARLQSLTDQPTFGNEGDDRLGKDFMQKYTMSMMVPDDQKVSGASIDFLRRQQPSEGVNNEQVVVSDKMKYPGANGTQV